jgi:hypothetical protein
VSDELRLVPFVMGEGREVFNERVYFRNVIGESIYSHTLEEDTSLRETHFLSS